MIFFCLTSGVGRNVGQTQSKILTHDLDYDLYVTKQVKVSSFKRANRRSEINEENVPGLAKLRILEPGSRMTALHRQILI